MQTGILCTLNLGKGNPTSCEFVESTGGNCILFHPGASQ